jgi:hypothetical protein
VIRRTFSVGAAGIVAVLGLGMTFDTAALADERPDFSGVWTSYRGGPFGPTWPQNAPYTDEAREKIAAYRALVDGTGATPGEFCVGTGMPGSMLGSGGYPMEIIQRPEQVTIIYEAHTEIRRVYIEGPQVDPRDLFPTRNGFSTGWWEGETLVVETTHLKEAVDQNSAHSDEAHIVERYRLGDSEDGRKLLIAELTMTDPRFYEEPVTVTKTWQAMEGGRMLHYECTEPDWEDFLDERRRLLE